jgi:hypothetical protein
MKRITLDLISYYQSEHMNMDNLGELMNKILQIQESFYNEEKLLIKEVYKI